MRGKPGTEKECVEKLAECQREEVAEWNTMVAILRGFWHEIKNQVEKEEFLEATATFSKLKSYCRNRTVDAGRLADKARYWRNELQKLQGAKGS